MSGCGSGEAMKFGVWLGWGAEQHETITESAPTQTAIKLYRNHRGRTINSKTEMKCAANWQQHYVKCACSSSSRRHLQHTQIGGTNGNRKNHQQKSQQKKKINTEYAPHHRSTAEAMYFQWSWTCVAAELCRPLRLQIGKYGKKY